MSDGAQGTVDTSAPAAEGPKEIFVVGQDRPAAEAPKDKPVDSGNKTEAPKGAGSEEQDEDDTRDGNGRFKKRGENLQSRIDEITRARREAERDAEYWKTRALGNQQQQPKGDGKPVRDQFNSDEEYQEAAIDYRVKQALAQQDQERTVRDESTKKATSWQEKTDAARKELPDWDEVMSDNETQVAMHVAEIVMDHDDGAKIVHHLAKNPDMVEKLNEMSPVKAAFEIAKLARQFEKAPETESSSKPAPQVSKAPPPPSKAVGAGRSTEKSPADMSMEEYRAWRKAQGASWAR